MSLKLLMISSWTEDEETLDDDGVLSEGFILLQMYTVSCLYCYWGNIFENELIIICEIIIWSI